jgi:hypothetical protein
MFIQTRASLPAAKAIGSAFEMNSRSAIGR